MQHAGHQYGQGALPSSSHQPPPPPYDPPAAAPQQHQQPSPGGLSITSSLRQWRKKDAQQQQQQQSQPPQPQPQPLTPSSEQTLPQINTENVARVAPQAHYSRPSTDIYRFPPQYPDYGLSFKDVNTPVKYSEIVENIQPHLQQDPKEKEYLKMCSIQQQHLKQYPEPTAMKPPYPGTTMKQPYDTALHPQMHPYMQKESQMPPYMQKEMQYPSQCFQKFNVQPTQYGNNYVPESNGFLAALSKINPMMAQSIINDTHVRETSSMGYANVERGHGYGHPQRLYPNQPSMHTSPGYTAQRNIAATPQPYSCAQQYGYKPPPDGYNRLPQYQAGSYKVGNALEQTHELPSPRQPYRDNIPMPMNYAAVPQKISPNYPQCSQLEYSQHYQHRRYQMPPEYYTQNYKNPYLQPQELSPVVAAETAVPSARMKQFWESWGEEEVEAVPEATPQEPDKRKEERPAEQLYVLGATEIPRDSLGQYVQIEALPENMRELYESGGIIIKAATSDNCVQDMEVVASSSNKINILDHKRILPGATTSVADQVVNLHIVEAPSSQPSVLIEDDQTQHSCEKDIDEKTQWIVEDDTNNGGRSPKSMPTISDVLEEEVAPEQVAETEENQSEPCKASVLSQEDTQDSTAGTEESEGELLEEEVDIPKATDTTKDSITESNKTEVEDKSNIPDDEMGNRKNVAVEECSVIVSRRKTIEEIVQKITFKKSCEENPPSCVEDQKPEPKEAVEAADEECGTVCFNADEEVGEAESATDDSKEVKDENAETQESDRKQMEGVSERERSDVTSDIQEENNGSMPNMASPNDFDGGEEEEEASKQHLEARGEEPVTSDEEHSKDGKTTKNSPNEEITTVDENSATVAEEADVLKDISTLPDIEACDSASNADLNASGSHENCAIQKEPADPAMEEETIQTTDPPSELETLKVEAFKLENNNFLLQLEGALVQIKVSYEGVKKVISVLPYAGGDSDSEPHEDLKTEALHKESDHSEQSTDGSLQEKSQETTGVVNVDEQESQQSVSIEEQFEVLPIDHLAEEIELGQEPVSLCEEEQPPELENELEKDTTTHTDIERREELEEAVMTEPNNETFGPHEEEQPPVLERELESPTSAENEKLNKTSEETIIPAKSELDVPLEVPIEEHEEHTKQIETVQLDVDTSIETQEAHKDKTAPMEASPDSKHSESQAEEIENALFETDVSGEVIIGSPTSVDRIIIEEAVADSTQPSTTESVGTPKPGLLTKASRKHFSDDDMSVQTETQMKVAAKKRGGLKRRRVTIAEDAPTIINEEVEPVVKKMKFFSTKPRMPIINSSNREGSMRDLVEEATFSKKKKLKSNKKDEKAKIEKGGVVDDRSTVKKLHATDATKSCEKVSKLHVKPRAAQPREVHECEVTTTTKTVEDKLELPPLRKPGDYQARTEETEVTSSTKVVVNLKSYISRSVSEDSSDGLQKKRLTLQEYTDRKKRLSSSASPAIEVPSESQEALNHFPKNFLAHHKENRVIDINEFDIPTRSQEFDEIRSPSYTMENSESAKNVEYNFESRLELYKQKQIEQNDSLMRRFLNNEKLTENEMLKVKEIIHCKRMLVQMNKLRMEKLASEQKSQVYERVDHKSNMKLHLKKISEPNKPRKRFRNLYAESSSDSEEAAAGETSRDPRINRRLHGDAVESDYLAYQTKAKNGVPKIIIKRRTPNLQPYVRLERSPHIDLMAKRRRVC